jgi:hypothetical protein
VSGWQAGHTGGYDALLTQAAMSASHPLVFVAATALALGWALLEPRSFSWPAIAILATLYAVLLVHRAAHQGHQQLLQKLEQMTDAAPRALLVDHTKEATVARKDETSNS